MARRSRARDLAGLAALGALGYTFFGPGRDRKDGTKAPVEYRDVSGAAPGGVGPSSAAPAVVAPAVVAPAVVAPNVAAGPQETFMGLDDVSGPLAETGGVGRVNVSAADQRAMPPPVSNAQAAAAPVRATAPTPARAAAPAKVNEAARGRGTNRASVPAVIGPRSTGRGGATAAELAEYQRQQERDRMRGRGYGTTYKKGGSVKAKPKKMASGGMSSASKRADGIATKGKTKCKMY